MTRQEALQALRENERNVIDPEFAQEIATAFGETLESLVMPMIETKHFDRLNYAAEDADKLAVSVYELASSLAEALTGQKVYSNMNGRGSYADDITRKSVALLSN